MLCHPLSADVSNLGPGVLLAEQVGVEVGHLPVPLVCETPH